MWLYRLFSIFVSVGIGQNSGGIANHGFILQSFERIVSEINLFTVACRHLRDRTVAVCAVGIGVDFDEGELCAS